MASHKGNVLLTVTELTEEIEAGLKNNDLVFRFKMLPFLAVQSAHPWASNPPTGTRVTAFTNTSYALAWSINRALLEASHLARTWAPNGNRWVVGSKQTPMYPTFVETNGGSIEMLPLVENVRIAHPVAISLSLQLRQGRVLADDELLSITTRIASRSMPLLVAAGNWGVFGEGSLSPLAKLPWTIAVGATSDEAGTKRLPQSSVGIQGSNLMTGVTVVAYGGNPFVPGTFGTSYAVPRALAQVMTMTAFVLQIKQVDMTRRTGLLGGIPLLLRISVDTGFASYDPQPSLLLPMIPRVGVHRPAVLEIIEIIERAGISPVIEPESEIVRRMLIDSARPMPELDASEVGAGFVSSEGTLAYLEKFNGLDFAELFTKDLSLDESSRARLKQIRLAEPAKLAALEEIARRSSLAYAIDFRSGQIHASMRDPGMETGARGFSKEPSQYSWPPQITSNSVGENRQ